MLEVLLRHLHEYWHLNGAFFSSEWAQVRESEDRLCKHLLSFLLGGLCFLTLDLLLLLDYLSHLFDWNCTLDVNPFVKNRVAVSKLQNQVNTANVDECNKSKSSGFLGSFVL